MKTLRTLFLEVNEQEGDRVSLFVEKSFGCGNGEATPERQLEVGRAVSSSIIYLPGVSCDHLVKSLDSTRAWWMQSQNRSLGLQETAGVPYVNQHGQMIRGGQQGGTPHRQTIAK